MSDWFARPVLHVSDVESSLRFYVDLLGFSNPWRYEEDGVARVAQVERLGTALILANNLAPDRIGQATVFVSVNTELPSPQAGIEELDALRAELEAKGVVVRDGSWGYRLLVIDDLDGNQLLFNYPGEDPA